jgi:hypothetical protein
MNRTATQVITRALRVCKALGADQSPAAFTLSEGYLLLTEMLDEWWSDPQLHISGETGYELPWFADLTSTVAVPTGLTAPIVYELAKRIAPEHGAAFPPELQAAARAGLANWRRRIAAHQVPKLKGDAAYVVGQTAGRYNILTDA